MAFARWDFAPGAVTGRQRHSWPYFVTPPTDATRKTHDGENVTSDG